MITARMDSMGQHGLHDDLVHDNLRRLSAPLRYGAFEVVAVTVRPGSDLIEDAPDDHCGGGRRGDGLEELHEAGRAVVVHYQDAFDHCEG